LGGFTLKKAGVFDYDIPASLVLPYVQAQLETNYT